MKRGLTTIAVLGALVWLLAACGKGENQIVTVVKEVPVEKEVIKEVQKEVIVTQEVIKEVPKEVIKEVEKVVTRESVVEKEVVVTREVVKEVVRTVEVETEKVLIATPTPLTGGQPKFGGTLRSVSQASIGAIDPGFSNFSVVTRIASQFYETLFGWDKDLQAAPRLIDKWSLGSDGLTYTFKLRSGVKFHDGSDLDSADAVASVKRWVSGGAPAAGIIRRFVPEDFVSAVDGLTFTFTLNEPLGALIDMMGIPHPMPPIQTSEMAATPFTEHVSENIGTGPFKMVEWRQGDRIIMERNENYKARTDASCPGCYAGATIAYLDGVVFLEIPDEETKIAGLETGEWDVVDSVALDFYKRLNDNPKLQVAIYKPGHRSNVYLNPQISPFSYQKARQALMTAIDVEDFMFALGDRDVWIICPALYYCGTPYETDFGSRYDVETSQGTRTIGYDINDMETAQILLSDSDYAGETAVLLNPTDYGTITPLGHVLKPVMQEIGFNVEMPALDWATIVSMFGNTDSYSAATDWYEHYAVGNPAVDHLSSGAYDFILRDEQLIQLQLDFARETDFDKRFEIAEQMQARRYEVVTSLSLGIWFGVIPATNKLKNFEVKAKPFYANVWLEE
ncbi:MAG: hypothetical protein FJ312_04600 [SAR202 cluster bacterium]|nr:hypothetical protein [SAR202 cluster bacterium]